MMFSGSDGMPPLVEGPAGFIPPPAGATMGGQPAGGWPNEGGGGGYTPYSPGPVHPPPGQQQQQPPPWVLEQQMQMQMQGRYPSFGPPHNQPNTPYMPFSPQSPWSVPTPGGTHSYGPGTPGGSFGGPQTPVSAGAGGGGPPGGDPWGIAARQQAAGLIPPPEGAAPVFDHPALRHSNSLPHNSHNHPGWNGGGGGYRPNTPYIGTPKRKKSGRRRSKSRSRPGTPFQDGFDDDEDFFHGGGGGFGFNGGAPLQRAKSAGPAGGGEYYKPPMHPFGGYPQEFGQGNLSRRPRDWRADFDAKQGLASFIPRKHKSNVKEYVDPEKRHLTPLLEYKPDKPNIFYDIRHSIYDTSRPILYFPNLKRAANQIDLHQLATVPSCQFMRLFHHLLPWYVDVHASNPNGITLEDVLFQINNQLNTSIVDRDFWTDALTNDIRIQIGVSFSRRVGDINGVPNAEEWRMGIKRMDFLKDQCIFEGLVRSKGMWEIKTRNLNDYHGFSGPGFKP